jgi:hypothetical protein
VNFAGNHAERESRVIHAEECVNHAEKSVIRITPERDAQARGLAIRGEPDTQSERTQGPLENQNIGPIDYS